MSKSQNIEAYQNPTILIEARKHTGSPSPEQVRSQIGALHEELESISKPMIEISSRTENAWQRCRNVNPGWAKFKHRKSGQTSLKLVLEVYFWKYVGLIEMIELGFCNS